MNEKIWKELLDAGVEVEQAVLRFGGNTGLYEKCLRSFIQDGTFHEISTAFSANDMKTAENAVHTLKGVAGNLSMTRLYNICSEMMVRFRLGEAEQAKALLGELTEAYQKIIAIIGG